MQLWDAFLEDYKDEIFDWSPRQLLEIFWHYCQDGSKAVYEFLNKDAVLTNAMHSDGEKEAVYCGGCGFIHQPGECPDGMEGRR